MKMYLSTITEVLSVSLFMSLAVVRPTGVYLLDPILLQYSVLFIVESLYLLYLLFIS